MSRRAESPDELVARAREGEARAVGRLISLVEDGSTARCARSWPALTPHAGNAHVVGLTGSPGVGKSTSTNALVAELRRRGLRVGVLAVDPSSPFSGGALLGDRIRMSEHATDPGVFIRSMAARGHLGGVSGRRRRRCACSTPPGATWSLVETVGVGQSEVEIARLADTTVVLLAPGMGDGIQAAKAGILEIGDVYVVNKADRDGADQVRRDLRSHARPWPSVARARGGRRCSKTVASEGQGAAEVVDAIDEHRDWAEESGELARRPGTPRARRDRGDRADGAARTLGLGRRGQPARRARERGDRGRGRPLRGRGRPPRRLSGCGLGG